MLVDGAGAEAQQEEEVGLPVPPVPSSWAVLRASFDVWANQLSYTVTAQPTVAAALLLMGALIGTILCLLIMTLTLGDNRLPPHYQPIPSALAGSGHGSSSNTVKLVKGE